MFTKFTLPFLLLVNGEAQAHRSRAFQGWLVSRDVVALRSELVSCLTTGQVMMGHCDAVPEGVTSVEGEAKDGITKF